MGKSKAQKQAEENQSNAAKLAAVAPAGAPANVVEGVSAADAKAAAQQQREEREQAAREDAED